MTPRGPIKPERKQVTITDVARLAGVSKTTVSRYINGKYEMIVPETRERIRGAIEQLRFRPSALAQSLKAPKSRMVGVVLSDISTPFSASLVRGIGDVMEQENYLPVFVNCDDSLQKEQEFIENLMDRQVDGLIVNTTTYQNPFLVELAQKGVPIVLCDRYVEGYDFDIAAHEHRTPMNNLVGHLAREGFARVGLFVQPYEHNSPRFLRRRSFMEAAARYYGVKNPEEWVYVIDIRDEQGTVRQLQRLLERCPAGQVPAVIGANTVTTLHVLGAIHGLHLRIPQDIGVCGADDFSWPTQMNWPDLSKPGITTFVVQSYQLGVMVAQMLLQRLSDPQLPCQTRFVPCDMVVRGSTQLGV